MTYDDWKTTDDTPEPDPNRCEVCGHPETYFGGTKRSAPAYCDCPCCTEPFPSLEERSE